MHATSATVGEQRFLPREELPQAVKLLQQEGYTVIGPVVVDGVVMLRPISTADDLAHGLCDEQSAGHYRLIPGDAEQSFEYVVGPDSPKRYLFPPTQRLFKMCVEDGQMKLVAGPPQPPKLAFFGVRPCEMAAMRVQDRVFGATGPSTFRCEAESYYQATRRAAVTLVVNCTRPGGTCFCHSMGTGPEATEGYDLALTELRGGFLIKAGTPAGTDLLGKLPTRDASAAELELADLKLKQAREHMGRRLDTEGLPEALHQGLEHPHWDEVAKRCLGCANCTMVCPTCFCSSVQDSTELSTGDVTRTRQWESCYTHEFSYTTAGPVRNTIRGRHRHWLRHKLSTWWEQFGTSGCVGCGRCITWCPARIDITQEAAAMHSKSHGDGVASQNGVGRAAAAQAPLGLPVLPRGGAR